MGERRNQMRRTIGFCLVVSVLAAVVAGCGGAGRISTRRPVQVMKITDEVYYHNISITFDPDTETYLTVNGGNVDYGIINEYDTDGELLDTYITDLDGRAIFYHGGSVLLKGYGSQVYEVDLTDIVLDWETLFEDFLEAPAEETEFEFEEDNSSPAMSADGKLFFEHVRGKVTVFDAATGRRVRSFNVEDYYDEHGYDMAIAASDNHVFLWSDADEVTAYDFKGKAAGRLNLPQPGYGFSLSYCNGILWISEDADAGTELGEGYWYGYRLE
jgi:outer membrane protein assembly factor BamB